ncbi:hypothetical protein [Micromonospora zhanjiangensis]|uniref:Uncharacterized protein n=1 Tax=Micromonospora zhanjiangensis TaxID=1522057 RepID=A0ABV8KI55_9ACTN
MDTTDMYILDEETYVQHQESNTDLVPYDVHVRLMRYLLSSPTGAELVARTMEANHGVYFAHTDRGPHMDESGVIRLPRTDPESHAYGNVAHEIGHVARWANGTHARDYLEDRDVFVDNMVREEVEVIAESYLIHNTSHFGNSRDVMEPLGLSDFRATLRQGPITTADFLAQAHRHVQQRLASGWSPIDYPRVYGNQYDAYWNAVQQGADATTAASVGSDALGSGTVSRRNSPTNSARVSAAHSRAGSSSSSSSRQSQGSGSGQGHGSGSPQHGHGHGHRRSPQGGRR